jgi:fructose-bisphosphate aldolase class II
MLLPLKVLLDDARTGGYGVGTFTAFNMETARGVIDALISEQAPAAISITRRMTPYMDVEGLAHYIQDRAAATEVPLSLHLDHATDLALVERALRAGFSSVQYDGDNLSYADKVRTTLDAVAMAKAYNASTEAELEHIGRSGVEVGGGLTDPAEAADFVEATGIDILAVSIGSGHGQSEGEANLDIPRLQAIHEATSVHLALHGGTGVDPAQVVASIAAGITKISYFHGMAADATKRLAAELPNTPHGMIATLLDESFREAYGQRCREMLRVYGTPTRAPSAQPSSSSDD